MSEIRPTSAQELWLTAPVDHDVYVLGSRACGKTTYAALLFLQTAMRLGGRARMLYLRRSQPAGASFVDTCRLTFGPDATWNGNRNTFTFTSGATLTVAELADDRSLDKWLGQSYCLAVIDQLEQFASPKLPDRIRGSIRGPEARFVGLAHPGSVGTHWIRQRLVVTSEEGLPATDKATERPFIRFSATLQDNEHLSEADGQQLAASVAGDPALQRAHLEGDWTATGDIFLAGMDPDLVRFDPWPDAIGSAWWARDDLETFVAVDRGTRRPMVALLCWVSDGSPAPDQHVYPPGSFCFFDEVSTHLEGDLTLGDGSSIGEFCRLLTSRCDAYGIGTSGVVDPEVSAYHGHQRGTLLDEFRAHGVDVTPAPRHRRVEGWQKLKGLLRAAGSTDERGAYFSAKCAYWWQTSLVVPTDPHNIEDCDPRSHLDHGLDAARYAIMAEGSASAAEVVVRDLWTGEIA